MASLDKRFFTRWIRYRDTAAFAELAARHSGMVYAACKRVLGN